MAEICSTGLHQAALRRIGKPWKAICECFVGRKFIRKQVIGAGRDHHLAEESFLILEMAIDRLN
jgi:hypothetical protein